MKTGVDSALSYGWSDPAKPETYNMSFHPVSRPVGSWREELNAAAIIIANTAQKRIKIAFSGGLESEVLCRTFFDQGIQFSALTLAHRTNRKEVAYARQWCLYRGIPHEIVPFDAASFLTIDVDRYMAAGYVTGSVYRYLQLRIMEIIELSNSFGVLGNGKLSFQPNRADSNDTCMSFGTSFAAPFEWMKMGSVRHQPYFFLSTPEVVLSFLRTPLVEAALRTPHVFDNSSNNIALRRLVYQTFWPDIPSRPSLYGFERERLLKNAAEHRMLAYHNGKNKLVDMSVASAIAILEGHSKHFLTD